MHVAVGSANPTKVAAVESILGRFDPTATPVDVDSGVAEQPRSVEETASGAAARARRALETVPDADLAVGLEGGVARVDALDGLFLIMWAGATDGTRLERAAGPSLRLPADVASRVEDDEELGPVMDDRTGTEGVARGRGAAGVLTGGLIDRQTALETAVAGAVGPFVTGQYESGDDRHGSGNGP